MKVRKYDHNMGIGSVVHLEAENIEEQQFFNRIWMCGSYVVSYNGSDKLAISDGKKEVSDGEISIFLSERELKYLKGVIEKGIESGYPFDPVIAYEIIKKIG